MTDNPALIVLIVMMSCTAGFCLGAIWKHIFQRLDEREIRDRAWKACEEHYARRDRQIRTKYGNQF